MSDISHVVLLSGKRKSGKDYVADLLVSRLDPHATIGRLSAPLKKGYAEEHGINYEELLTAGPFKEQHRLKMIAWGEARRKSDPGFFARRMINDICSTSAARILIVSDARRPSDLAFFRDAARASAKTAATVAFAGCDGNITSGSGAGGCGARTVATTNHSKTSNVPALEGTTLLTVRVEASLESRAGRGWKFTAGVDDVASECGLDDVADWDFVLHNDDRGATELERGLAALQNAILN